MNSSSYNQFVHPKDAWKKLHFNNKATIRKIYLNWYQYAITCKLLFNEVYYLLRYLLDIFAAYIFLNNIFTVKQSIRPCEKPSKSFLYWQDRNFSTSYQWIKTILKTTYLLNISLYLNNISIYIIKILSKSFFFQIGKQFTHYFYISVT